MKKIVLILILCLYYSTSFSDRNGGYAGAFLRMGLGAHSISLGNTGVAQEVSAYSCFYNPAAFGFIEERMVGLSHSFLSLDRRVNYISFSVKVPPEAGVSLSWIESGVGGLKNIDNSGNELGNINHSTSAVYFSFGRRFSENISAGLSVKFLFESLSNLIGDSDYSSKGVGLDFGVLYILNEQLIFGYQLKDLLSKFEANTSEIFERGGTTIDKFPLIHKIGCVYKTNLKWLNVIYEFEFSNKEAYEHHFGVEAIHGKNLALRIGYDNGLLTFGAGMDFQFYNTDSFLDYAFLPSVIDEGSSHIFSWQITF